MNGFKKKKLLGDTTTMSSGDMMKEEMILENNGTEDPMNGGLSMSSRFKFTAIKFLKLYYTPLVVASLQMIHCVDILGVRHLYVHGPTLCYTSWQIVIFTVILPGILLFPISFELALRLLKERVISSSLFVLGSGCPYFAIFLYIKQLVKERRTRVPSTAATNDMLEEERVLTSEQNSLVANDINKKIDGSDEDGVDEMLCVQTILQTEEELFKNEETSSFQWQVIQVRTCLLRSEPLR